MEFISHYTSPLGRLTLASDGLSLTGLWFEGQKYYARTLSSGYEESTLPVFDKAAVWLDTYFSGADPGPVPPLAPRGTPFQQTVWEILLTIPYGKTVTYGDVAKALSERDGRTQTSARAVGGAAGRNPISIFIPCHRVIGAGGDLTGYAGGMDRKRRLLLLERSGKSFL